MPTTAERQPAIYIAHGGGPWPFMHEPDRTHAGLRVHLEALASSLPRPPSAVAVITAHREAPEFTVSSAPQPSMIYDYGGFPPHTYDVIYPAPGAPEVARRIIELGNADGITVAESDCGFDHGVFVPLHVAWPRAQVPIVSVSLRSGLDPVEHIAFGAALEALRAENVLVLGSGLSIHDLSFRITSHQAGEFDDWLEVSMNSAPEQRMHRLARWEDAPSGRIAHPREEHLLPLMTVVGAAGPDSAQRTFREELYGLRTASYCFG